VHGVAPPPPPNVVSQQARRRTHPRACSSRRTACVHAEPWRSIRPPARTGYLCPCESHYQHPGELRQSTPRPRKTMVDRSSVLRSSLSSSGWGAAALSQINDQGLLTTASESFSRPRIKFQSASLTCEHHISPDLLLVFMIRSTKYTTSWTLSLGLVSSTNSESGPSLYTCNADKNICHDQHTVALHT
jgi:hypothetical protein